LVKLELDDQVWIGNVEIHIKTSDWFKHNHQHDINYRNTILHVVWLHDTDFFSLSPVLALSGYDFLYPQLILEKDFSFLKQSANDLNGSVFEKFSGEKYEWGLHRLKRRSEQLIKELTLNNDNWEQTIWIQLAKTFGSRVNGLAFAAMASAIPFWLFKIYKHDRLSLEALFMGQLGLLFETPADQYLIDLNQLHNQFQKKYCLKPSVFPVYLLRMRPNNFPAVRLSQLASYLWGSHFDLNYILNAENIQCFDSLSTIETSDYWKTHLMPGKSCSPFSGFIGQQMTISIIINVYVPFLYAYGLNASKIDYIDKAISLLHQLPPENNAITRKWNEKGVKVDNAFESQSLIEFQQYFIEKR
jgi:hypothetical protein